MTGGIDGPFMRGEEGGARSHAPLPAFHDLVNVTGTPPEMQLAAWRSGRAPAQVILESRAVRRSGRIVLAGPAPAPLSRLRGDYRWHLLVKSARLEVEATTSIKSAP